MYIQQSVPRSINTYTSYFTREPFDLPEIDTVSDGKTTTVKYLTWRDLVIYTEQMAPQKIMHCKQAAQNQQN